MATEKKHHIAHIHGLVQERCISIANTMELRLSCTNPSMGYHINDSLQQWCRKDYQGIFSSCLWGLMGHVSSSLRSLALCGTGELGSCSDWWGFGSIGHKYARALIQYKHYTSPASGLFTRPFIQTQIKENVSALHHWPLCYLTSIGNPIVEVRWS